MILVSDDNPIMRDSRSNYVRLSVPVINGLDAARIITTSWRGFLKPFHHSCCAHSHVVNANQIGSQRGVLRRLG